MMGQPFNAQHAPRSAWLSAHAHTLFCSASEVRAELSSIAYEGPALTIRFFCRFSSRLFLRSSMMLSSLFLRASSASTPFLYSFLRGTPAAGFIVALRASGKRVQTVQARPLHW